MKTKIQPPRAKTANTQPGDPSNSFRTPAGRLILFEPANTVTLSLIESGITQDYKEREEPLDPPTYEVKTAGGGSQRFVHDEKTIAGKPELEKAFADHKAAVARLGNAINKAKYEYCLECITNELPADPRWIDRQKKKGIRIPEDPEERRLHYITTELIRTPEDSIILFMEVTTAGLRGVLNETDIEKVRESFRGIVSGGNGKNPIAERLTRAAKEARGELDSLP